MTDYKELVKALRILQDKNSLSYYKRQVCKDAAAAIEELQAEVERLEPKRGEIVRCKECIHFTQGGWCDREFDWFPVDENDFCSMAEKMEVQE